MAWDFSTEPEFQAHLDWMREFVRTELWPLETIARRPQLRRARPRSSSRCRSEVKRRGLWAAHLPPELGGQGFGQVKLALMHEILGTTAIAPTVFGNQAPDSGNGEILAIAGTPEQKQRFVDPLLAGELRSAFSMTEPGVAGSDPTQIQTRARRDGDEYVIDGHKWFSSNASRADFLIVMAVTDPDAAPHRRASMFIVPIDTPGVNIVRDVPTMEFPTGHNALARRPRGDRLRGRPRRPPTRCSAARARASRSPSSGSARGASTTACASSASPSARSTCSASARPTARATAGCSASTRRCRTGSRTRPRRCTRRG